MKLPSASSLKRVMLCPGSQLLPQVGDITESSEKGNHLHNYLAARLAGKSEADALALIPEPLHAEAREFDLSGLPQFEWVRAEAAFGYDPDTRTVEFLGEDIDRQYEKHGLTEEQFPVTVDLAGRTIEGRLVVADWKTGNARTVEPAKKNAQLFLGALAARTKYGGAEAEDVDVAIIRTQGEVRYDWATLDAFELEMFSDTLAALKAELRGMDAGKPKLVQGEHCRYCPAFNSCPAKVALIRALSVTPGMLSDDIKGMLTPENASVAYQRFRTVNAALQRIRAAFAEYATRSPIPLPDGRVYGQKETETAELDPLKVKDALSELYGPSIAELALSYDTSKAAIDRAVATIAPRGQKAAMVRNALAAVEAKGGVVLKRKTELKEYTPDGNDDEG